MDSLRLFMDDDDKDTVDSCYEEDGDLLVLKDDVTSGERDELNSIFGKPMIIVASFSSGGDEVNSMLTQMGIPCDDASGSTGCHGRKNQRKS